MRAIDPDVLHPISLIASLMHLFDPIVPHARYSRLAMHHHPTRLHGRHISDRRTMLLQKLCAHRRGLVLHACSLQLVRPLPTRTCMAMFQVLPEMIGAEEFLGLIALAEFVDIDQMLDPIFPVRVRYVGELLAAVATDIGVRDLVGGS